MTNRQFILSDMQSGDFYDYEIKAIEKTCKRKNSKHKAFLNAKYEDYAEIENFYNEVTENL